MGTGATESRHDQEILANLLELLVVALQLIDELDLPADIGAHLDLTIERLAAVNRSHARQEVERLAA